MRFNSDGTLDTTFSGGGFSIQFGGTLAVATSVALQPDGKIVAAGYATLPGQDVVVARINPDGSLDGTFDGDGRASVNFQNPIGGASLPDYLTSVRIAPDGKIVLVGMSVGSGTASFHRTIARLNSNGSLDTSFDSDGKLVDLNGTGGWSDVIPHSDGTMSLIGSASFQFSWNTTVAKLDSGGDEMWTSMRGGTPGCYGNLSGIAQQGDGKLVVVGNHECKPFAFRLNTDGSWDNSFSNTPIELEGGGGASGLAIQSDGKILVNLFFGANGVAGFSLARLNTDGMLDTTYGTNGIARNHIIQNAIERGGSVIVQPDGKVLVGGYVRLGSEDYRLAMVRYQGAAAVPVRTQFDYDGDGKSDISVFRPSENKWYILRSSDFGVTQTVFAIAGDVPVPADYDGDNRTDIAIYRASNGTWWYLSSETGSQLAAQWGQAGDVPRPSDFDGDGRADYVLFRPSDNFWYRASSENGTVSNVNFGSAGDKPVIGDFDGDGKSDPAIYRPASGDWWYRSSINGAQLASHWGLAGDVPATGDFDGDGKTDLAVFRPSTGIWYIVNSANATYTITGFGLSDDKPVPADYDGDGRADIAVFRPSTGVWYLMRSTSGFAAANWGIASDIPTQHAFVP